MDSISNLLIEIKNKTGDSEVALAKRLGVSQPTVNRILNGQTECMAKTLLRIQELHRGLPSGPCE